LLYWSWTTLQFGTTGKEESYETPPGVYVAAGESAVQRCEKDRKWKATHLSKERRKQTKYSTQG